MAPDGLRPKPPKRVKAWLDEHAQFESHDDGQLTITYTARTDLVPPDVERWVDAWRFGPTTTKEGNPANG